MQYTTLLQQNEIDFIVSLQKELGFNLTGEFNSDFKTIKSALKDKFGPLKDSENVTELGITLSQIKKTKEIQSYLKEIEDQMIASRDEYVSDIEKEFANW